MRRYCDVPCPDGQGHTPETHVWDRRKMEQAALFWKASSVSPILRMPGIAGASMEAKAARYHEEGLQQSTTLR